MGNLGLLEFRSVFIAVVIGGALIVAASLLNAKRPAIDVAYNAPEYVLATGKCAACHRLETAAIVHQYESSVHAAKGVNCLECHAPQEGQESLDHSGCLIATTLTSKNCAQCHKTEYDQFLMSRHAAPAWAGVRGSEDFTEEQIAHAERFHPGAVKRPANALAILEGPAAVTKGCMACHKVGRPNPDGSIGSCTDCHARHSASVALAREPQTCGQCHMGPDHSQLEIYSESKHGILFNAQKRWMNLAADPKTLTTKDMSVPTCATCHMSGLDGLKVTHDTTERLSYWLFASVSDKRPHYNQAQSAMQEVCAKCHTRPRIEQFYLEAERVVDATNQKVLGAQELEKQLREEGHLTPEPFDEPFEFLLFDYWHYWGRTAKHGAFMGGADFVQWHGNYELLAKMVELESMAEELRRRDPGDD